MKILQILSLFGISIGAMSCRGGAIIDDRRDFAPSAPDSKAETLALTSGSSNAAVAPSFVFKQAVTASFPALANFYSPSIIFDAGAYKMWTTSGDRVIYLQSPDGINWTGGQTVFSALPKTWEDDGGTFQGYTTGISDPRVVKNATAGWNYTMYYTAGVAPNNASSGGIGTAVSNDGLNWQRVGPKPMRSFPGGNTFVMQALKIRGKRYVFFLGGGNQVANQPPVLRVIEDLGNGISFGPDQILSNLPANTYPLFYDAASDSCWMAGNSLEPSITGPQKFYVYRDSDCFTTAGTKIAEVDSTSSGNVTNFGAQAVQRDSLGMRSGTTNSPLALYFASGNQWGGWQPKAVVLYPTVSASPRGAAYQMGASSSSEELWPASNAIDGNPSTSYSSKNFSSSANSRGTILSAWIKDGQKPVNQVILTSREGNQGFPVSYQVLLTSPLDPSKFINLGTFTAQPKAGKAVVQLPAAYMASGVGIVPVQLGKDSNGSFYFQTAELQLVFDNPAPPANVPPAPTGVTMTSTSPTQVTVNWTSGGGSTAGYYLAFGPGTASPICTGGLSFNGATSSYSRSDLSPNFTITVTVCAVDAAGTISPGVSVTQKTQSSVGTPPPAPVGFNISVDSAIQLTTQWASGGGTTAGFYIAYGVGTGVPDCKQGVPLHTKTSDVRSDFAPGQTITVSVCSVDASGNFSAGVFGTATTLLH